MDRGGHPLTDTGRDPRWLLGGVPAGAFVAVFFVYPLVSIVMLGLAPDGRLDLAAVGRVLGSPSVRDVIAFTFALAAASTVLTVLVGLPGAFVLARYDFPGRSLVRALTVVPFVLPTVVVASAFLALLGPRSPVNALLAGIPGGTDQPPLRLDGSVWAVLVAHVFYNQAVVVRIVGGLWERLDGRQEEAARMLGAGRWRAFREATLPRLMPAIASSSSLVFLFTFTSFGVVLLLGGPRSATIEVEIYRRTAQLLDLSGASVLALVQVTVVVGSLLLYGRFTGDPATAGRLVGSREGARRPAGRAARWGVAAVVGAVVLFLGLPLAVLVERSLAGPGGYGLDAYRGLVVQERLGTLFVPAAEAIANSLRFAAVATLLAVAVGLPAAVLIGYRRGGIPRALDTGLMLPLGTSAVLLGFGFVVALDEPPLDLRTSPWLIPIAHALVGLPFVVRATVPVIRSIDARLREAAQVLGAGPARVWREVDLPFIGRAALVGSAFAATVSLGEFGATVFIARPDVPTVPVAVFRLLGRPGQETFAQAMALSTVLMLMTAGVVLLAERLGARDARPF